MRIAAAALSEGAETVVFVVPEALGRLRGSGGRTARSGADRGRGRGLACRLQRGSCDGQIGSRRRAPRDPAQSGDGDQECKQDDEYRDYPAPSLRHGNHGPEYSMGLVDALRARARKVRRQPGSRRDMRDPMLEYSSAGRSDGEEGRSPKHSAAPGAG